MAIETARSIAATALEVLVENAAVGAPLALDHEPLDVFEAGPTPGSSVDAMIREGAGDGRWVADASGKGVELTRRTARRSGSPRPGCVVLRRTRRGGGARGLSAAVAAVAEVARRSCAAYAGTGPGAAVRLPKTGLPARRRPGRTSPCCPGGARSC